jgi:putative spermidine/putrescine transport system permease protein
VRPSVTFQVFRVVALTLFAAFFALPLVTMLDFSTKIPVTGERTWSDWAALVQDEALRESIVTSLILAVLTAVVMVVLLVPTMIWVRLRVPGASWLIESLCLLPLAIPALVIVVGIKNVMAWVSYFVGDTPLALTLPYVILVLPFAYRSIDAALAAIDVRTLSEAARSLGAGWPTVFVRIVLPNITTGVLSAATITVALVLGEFTFASLLNYLTMPVEIAAIYKVQARAAVAAALASILVVALLLLVLSYVSRDRRTKEGSAA